MELFANAEQLVTANQNVLFTDVAIPGCRSIIHRAGSGLVTVRGLTNHCFARYKVHFNGNLAIPTGGNVGVISLAIAVDGEPVNATMMTITPAAVLEYFNVSAETYVTVPADCCSHISIQNPNTQSVLVENANLIIERVA